MGTGSGCNGQVPPSPKGTERGSVSAADGGRDGATSRWVAERTMFGSTTTSVGPPIIKRCSTLSRRMRISRRRLSTVAASMTARRGWRPRELPPPSRSEPNRRATHKVAPITTSNASMTNANLPIWPSPKRKSNFDPPCAPGARRCGFGVAGSASFSGAEILRAPKNSIPWVTLAASINSRAAIRRYTAAQKTRIMHQISCLAQ